MNVKSRHRESTPPVVAAERHGFTRVAVIRRIDSKPPTRVWSLLLPPSFLTSGRRSVPLRPDRAG